MRTGPPGGHPAAQPFPVAVRAATLSSGRPLRELAAQLDDAGCALSASTLSQWQKGHHLPRFDDNLRSRLFMLERLALVPAGNLVRALLATPGHRLARPAPQRTAPRRPAGPPGQGALMEAGTVLLERIGCLFGPDPLTVTQLARTEHHVLDHRLLPVRSEITATVTALTGTVYRYWHVHTTRSQAPVSIAAGVGCTAGISLDRLRPVRVGNGTTHQLAATELRLDQPLTAGAQHTFSFTVHHRPDAGPGLGAGTDPVPVPPDGVWTLVPTAAMRELRVSLDLDLDPTARRPHVRRVHWPFCPDPARAEATSIPSNHDHNDGSTAPILVTFPAPGWYGYCWDQPPPGLPHIQTQRGGR